MKHILFCLIFISTTLLQPKIASAKPSSKAKKLVQVKFSASEITASRAKTKKVNLKKKVYQHDTILSEVELEPLKNQPKAKRLLFVGPPEPPASWIEPFQSREIASDSNFN